MKKIMIAAAIAAVAAVANAASITWGSGTFKTMSDANGTWSGTTITTAGQVKGYYFNVSAAVYAAAVADPSAIFAGFTENGNSSTLSLASAVTTVNKTGSNLATGTIALKDTGTFAAGDTVYGVLVYTYTDPTYGEGHIATAGTYTFEAAANKTMQNMASSVGAWTTTAVPEPTSGLLLLLGVAGLALKRKRA